MMPPKSPESLALAATVLRVPQFTSRVGGSLGIFSLRHKYLTT